MIINTITYANIRFDIMAQGIYNKSMRKICIIEGCDRYVHGHGLCSKHWERMYTRGTVEDRKLVSVSLRPISDNINFIKNYLLAHVNIDMHSGCWIWKTQSYKYPNVKTSDGYINANRLAMYVWKKENPYSEDWVCHSCDNKKCINPDHLFWGTAKINTHDSILKNRRFTKLTTHDVIEIRQLLQQGIKGIELAQRFGVLPNQISRIKNNHIWKEVIMEAS